MNFLAAFFGNPTKRCFLLDTEWDFLKSHVANLVAVGRAEEAHQAVSIFFAQYVKAAKLRATTPRELAFISYFIAYKTLPELVHKRWSEFAQLWSGVIAFPFYLAFVGANSQRKLLSSPQLNAFKSFQGSLKSGMQYFLIEFPTPPAQVSMEELLAPGKSGGAFPVLGPYFAAILLHESTTGKSVYLLGQAPGGGTTLRLVTPSENRNCGPGSEPDAAAFLKLLRDRA